MILRALLLLMLAAVSAFGIWETRRWQTPEWRDLISTSQRRLRAWGLFFLIATLGLWLGGTFLRSPPRQARTHAEQQSALDYLGYWTLTVVCAVPLLPLALLDSRENIRRFQRERQSLTEQRTELVRDFLLREPSGSTDTSGSPKPAP